MKLSKKKNTLTKTVEPITKTRTDLTTHPINLELPTMTNNSILEQSPSEDKIKLTPIIESEKEPSKTSIKKITINDNSLNKNSDTITKTSYNFSTVSNSATKQGILKKIENYDNNSAKNIANIRLKDTYQEMSVRFHKNTEVKHFNCNLSLTKQVKKYQWRRQNYNLTKY
ncbi:uncharacterized protein LOC126910136 [Daktulosphaira vitifoliae]|uniref:uncharacterized protein LOC126910136 n=1 Tax=Daktulosphaira vitifoliae TaxID=58002 RepID=UPI0021AAD542|nr:uncharacterized protein LOC126910136 [Daktulosphaira vitifoliae]